MGKNKLAFYLMIFILLILILLNITYIVKNIRLNNEISNLVSLS